MIVRPPSPRARLTIVGFLVLALAGCRADRLSRGDSPSPVTRGLNVRDMADHAAQAEADSHFDLIQLEARAIQIRENSLAEAKRQRNPAAPWRERNILCLSGGGAYGAYAAGVLCGWSARGTRPTFDVVTGISTGALIAPFAFLGPSYDQQLKTLYTTTESKDLYRIRPLRGVFGDALADNAKLAKKVDEVLTLEFMRALACEHQKGRRLYIGTTAAEAKRFVVWDIGAIAAKGRPEDRELITQVLLGSSAIPGFFPTQDIKVDLDGQSLTERHTDGSVSQSLFAMPPYVPPEHRSRNPNHDMAGANVYAIVAGKLYADPKPIKPLALDLAGQEVSAILYSKTRAELQRLYTTTMLTGMTFHMTSIPEEYPAPDSGIAFEIPAMVGMFNEGYRLALGDAVWRMTAPGTERGEGTHVRAGTKLSFDPQGPPVILRK